MNQQLDLKINEIRSRLTDLSLLTLSIFFLPNVVIGIMRSLHYQYGVTDAITITVMVIYLLTFFFRKRIETKIKGIILIGGIFFIVNGAFYSYGLLSLGMSLSLISAVLASLLFERKEQMVVFGAIVSVVVLYGFLSVRGGVEVSLDVEKYMTSSFAWITQSVGIMTMVLMVFLAVTFVFRSLVSTSSQVVEAQMELEMLVEGALSADDLVAYLKKTDETSGIIATNLARAAELVKSFKEISVNQSSEMISRFNLCQYIDSVLLTLKHEYKNMNIAIAVECPGDMEIRSYPSAFSQVLTNLVMNAITHAFEGEARGNIRITANRIRRELVLKVVDDGVGIDADHLGRVFDPFFTTKRGAGGSGLGLNIVYNLVTDKLGGTITCTSTPRKGAVFTINIPDVVEVEEGV